MSTHRIYVTLCGLLTAYLLGAITMQNDVDPRTLQVAALQCLTNGEPVVRKDEYSGLANVRQIRFKITQKYEVECRNGAVFTFRVNWADAAEQRKASPLEAKFFLVPQ